MIIVRNIININKIISNIRNSIRDIIRKSIKLTISNNRKYNRNIREYIRNLQTCEEGRREVVLAQVDNFVDLSQMSLSTAFFKFGYVVYSVAAYE